MLLGAKLLKLDSHDGRDRGRISDVTCDVFGISPRLAFTLQRRRRGRIGPTLAPRSVGDGADGRGRSAVEVTLRKMDVARKRRLAAMAVALEESAEDEEESGLLQCKRAVWVKPWLTKKSLGMQNQLYEELLASDPEQYKRLLRLDIEQFHHLLALIEPKIVRQDTVMRSSVRLLREHRWCPCELHGTRIGVAGTRSPRRTETLDEKRVY